MESEVAEGSWLEACATEAVVAFVTLIAALYIIFTTNPFDSLSGLLIFLPLAALLAAYLIALRCILPRRR